MYLIHCIRRGVRFFKSSSLLQNQLLQKGGSESFFEKSFSQLFHFKLQNREMSYMCLKTIGSSSLFRDRACLWLDMIVLFAVVKLNYSALIEFQVSYV